MGILALIVVVLIALGVGVGSGKLQFIGNSADFDYTHTHDSDPLMIGSKSFSPGPLEYTCDDIGQRKIVYPEPRQECWKTRVLFDDDYYDFIPNQPVKINEYMTVTLNPKGNVYFDEEEGLNGEFEDQNDWKSVYHFDVDTDGILSTTVYQVKEEILLNSNQDFILKINNNLYDFNAGDAGAWVRMKHSLLERGETWETRKFGIKHGANSYLITPDTSELGEVSMEFQPFIEINADEKVTIRQSKPIELSYEVVMQIANDDQDQEDQEQTKWQTFIAWIKKNLLGWLY